MGGEKGLLKGSKKLKDICWSSLILTDGAKSDILAHCKVDEMSKDIPGQENHESFYWLQAQYSVLLNQSTSVA